MRASRAFHRPWATAPTDDEAFDAYLVDSRRPDFEAMLVCRREDRAILGFFNLSHITRGSLQSAYLGYAVGQPFADQGYMREGLELVAARGVPEAPTAPDRGQHPAGQSSLDRAGARRRLRARGLLAALPEDRRPVARPRAVGDPGRGLARAEPAARAAGRALIAGPDGDPPTGTARQRPPLTEWSPVQRADRRFRAIWRVTCRTNRGR